MRLKREALTNLLEAGPGSVSRYSSVYFCHKRLRVAEDDFGFGHIWNLKRFTHTLNRLFDPSKNLTTGMKVS